MSYSLFDKADQDIDVDQDVYDWSPPSQLNRVGQSFQYLSESSSQVKPTDVQYVRPRSAPVRSQRARNDSDLSLRQSSFKYDDQQRKRPNSSRGYRSIDNKGLYNRNSKQTANISPLVNSTSGIPQQFSNMTTSNSSLANGPLINKEDVDDDTMPFDEPEATLDCFSDTAISPLNSVALNEPVTTRDEMPARRQSYSVTEETDRNPRLTIPLQHSISTNLAKAKQSSEKKVNFMIDSAPSSSVTQESEVGNMITEIIQNAKQQLDSNETAEDKCNVSIVVTAPEESAVFTSYSADTTETNDPNSQTDLEKTTSDKKASEPLPQTTSYTADGSSPKDLDFMEQPIDPIEPGSSVEQIEETATPAASPNTPKKRSSLLVKKSSSTSPALTKKTSSGPALVKKVKSSTSKLGAKSSKQFDSKQSKTKQGGKQTSAKKPKNMGQDWKKTILQTMKK